MRMDGQTRPAPHHYVEALMRKIRFPNLEGYVRIRTVVMTGMGPSSDVYNVELEIQLHNWSALQNVEEAAYTLTIDSGQFIKGLGTGGYLGTQTYQSPPHPVLHYGLALRESHEFTIQSEISHKNADRIKIRLFFGGKNCPAKLSDYEIDLSRNTGEIGIIKLLSKIRKPTYERGSGSIGYHQGKNTYGVTR